MLKGAPCNGGGRCRLTPSGLVSLFKSPAYFVEELEQFFAKSIPAVGALPNAYYWHGNQPDLYAAFLFNAAGRPDLTQKWVRWILETKYGDRENGLDGNDDGGSLSAWYVLGSIGLFPTAGTDRYEFASPLWQRAEIKVGKPAVGHCRRQSGPRSHLRAKGPTQRHAAQPPLAKTRRNRPRRRTAIRDGLKTCSILSRRP